MLSLPLVPFTTEQAVGLGLDRKALSRAVADRRLIRVLTGVYVDGRVEVTTEVRAAAALLVLGESVVLCDRSAAWLHGVDTLAYAELDRPHQLEAFALRGHEATHRPECRGGTRDLRREDWQLVAGLRVTPPTRTAMDLACRLPRREALAAMDALARTAGFARRDLEPLLPRYRRRRGVVQARRLVPLVDPGAESAGESWTRLALLDHDLPRPRTQWWIERDGVPRYRLDLAYPHAQVAVEYDGHEWHSSSAARSRDQERRAWLRSQGWTIVVVTRDSFSREALPAWIREVRVGLGMAHAA
jgi:very-short-patch-repair endonuclease